MENHSKSQRFVCASDRIDLKKFEHESNRLFLLGLGIGMVFLSIVVSFVTFEKVRIIRARQIPIKLILRPQRPTEFYRISREDLIKSIRRRAVGKRTPSTGIETKTFPFPDHGEFEITRDYDPDTISSSDMLPDSLLIEEYASRRMKEPIPLKNQVLFDTGMFKSGIIIPPDNKKAIQGYVHIPLVLGEKFTPPDTLITAIRNLARVVNRYTNVIATSDRQVYLGSNDIFRYPFLYISNDGSIKLTEEEIWNLGHYIAVGGFVIFDEGLHKYGFSRGKESLKKMIRDVFNTISDRSSMPNLKYSTIAGKDYRFQYDFKPLQKDHDVHHCFFDFDHGAPPGLLSTTEVKEYIEGIYLGDRLVGIYCPQGYCRAWCNHTNEQPLKMGVNMVMYALRQGRRHYILEGKWSLAASGPMKMW